VTTGHGTCHNARNASFAAILLLDLVDCCSRESVVELSAAAAVVSIFSTGF